MKVLNQLHNPTIVSQLTRIYPVQSLAFTGFCGAYNSCPSATFQNHNQTFLNSFPQYNPSPSINYSHLPITNSIPIHYYSCQSLPINYSVPNLSYPGRYNSVSSIDYSSLPTPITYYSPKYQLLNPHLISPIFYAPQSSNLSHNIVSSNSSNYNLSSYRSNPVVVASKPPIEFADNFSMRIKKADDSCDNLNLKQIASLVPNGFTAGILEPEIDPRDNKLKICNSVSLSKVPNKIWIRNGDNLVEVPNNLLEKNPQIYNQNLDSLPVITQQSKASLHDSRFDQPLPKIMRAFVKLNESLIRINKITNLEEEILGANFFGEDLLTSTPDNELTSISDSTTPLSSTLSLSPSPPSTTINLKLEIMTPDKKMVNGDLEKYELGSKFIFRFAEKPELTGKAILC